jgi:hypothetical protein
MTPKTERFEMRLDEQTVASVDSWRGKQSDLPSRAEAIRRLIGLGLARNSSDTVRFSHGERLIVTMLRDIYKHLKVDGDIDPAFIGDVLFGGHYWALRRELPGLFHDYEDDPRGMSAGEKFGAKIQAGWASLNPEARTPPSLDQVLLHRRWNAHPPHMPLRIGKNTLASTARSTPTTVSMNSRSSRVRSVRVFHDHLRLLGLGQHLQP